MLALIGVALHTVTQVKYGILYAFVIALPVIQSVVTGLGLKWH